jgi:hypothetical protein
MVPARTAVALAIALLGLVVVSAAPAVACPAEGFDEASGFSIAAQPTMDTAGPIEIPGSLAAVPRLRTGGEPAFSGVALGLLVLTLTVFLYWYRREHEPEARIRVASAAGLWALIFWSCTSAMPWVGVVGDAGLQAMCFLGAEGPCSVFFPENLAALYGPGGDVHLFELYRWHHAVIGIRAGQTIALFFLLPSLIWLLIDPRNRLALSAAAICGFATAFALLATVYYRAVVPSWLDVEIYRTFTIAVISTSAIVVAVATIVANAVRDPRPGLPTARVVSR